MQQMQPLPETREALTVLARLGVEDVEGDVSGLVERAVLIVPELVGMSFSIVSEGVTFTYVATSLDVAALDAAQDLDGGPCIQALSHREVLESEHDLFDEDQWQLFSQPRAAAGVRSTLSLPIVGADGTAIGGFNLYGPDPDTFKGNTALLAAALGAWEPAAVHNADLSFETRREATRTRHRLEERAIVDQAIGVLVARQRIDPDTAADHLFEAAGQAGIYPVALATLILEEHREARRNHIRVCSI